MGQFSPTYPANPRMFWGNFGKPVNRSVYLLPLGLLLVTLPISKALSTFGSIGIYLPLVVAIALSTWFGGIGPALACQIGGALVAFSFLVRPLPDAPVTAVQVYDLLGFLVVGKLSLFLVAYARWSRHLQENCDNLQLVAAATNDAIWEWDLASGRISLTGNLSTLFGHEGPTMEKTAAWWRELIHPDDSEAAWDDLNKLLDSSANAWSRDYRLNKNGVHILVACRGTVVRNSAGEALRMIGGLSDITAVREAQERLAFEALHDAVTGLPNRQCFRDRLRHTIAAMTEDSPPAAVLFLDLDRFKTVNDSLGHAIGDKLLRAVSKRVQLCLRPGETAARFGGDEFTVLIGSVPGPAETMRIAERVQQAIAVPYELEGHTVVITASIGIALARKGAIPEDILRHADVAMYRSKAQGRARSEMFESGLDAPRMNLIQLESDIRKGLAEGEFVVHYQAIVNLQTGELAGVEALVRWRHHRRGLLLPVEFVPLAEESGLIRQLGQWILETACAQMANWRTVLPAAHKLYINVNIAEKQFLDPGLPGVIASCLQRYNLDGPSLVLELTENAILGDTADAARRMHALRQTGISFALDDFGKGHSSLARLDELPISILKLDSAFVQAIAEGRPALSDAIVALGHELQLDVTAECVETREQVEHLRRVQCTAAQGNFFAPPLDGDSFLDLIRSQKRWRLDFGHASGA